MRLITSRDRVERILLRAVTKKALEVREQFDKRLAFEIASAVGQLMGGD